MRGGGEEKESKQYQLLTAEHGRTEQQSEPMRL